MKRTKVIRDNRVIGFTWVDLDGDWWYATGKPSDHDYVAMPCPSEEIGIDCILEEYQEEMVCMELATKEAV